MRRILYPHHHKRVFEDSDESDDDDLEKELEKNIEKGSRRETPSAELGNDTNTRLVSGDNPFEDLEVLKDGWEEYDDLKKTRHGELRTHVSTRPIGGRRVSTRRSRTRPGSYAFSFQTVQGTDVDELNLEELNPEELNPKVPETITQPYGTDWRPWILRTLPLMVFLMVTLTFIGLLQWAVTALPHTNVLPHTNLQSVEMDDDSYIQPRATFAALLSPRETTSTNQVYEAAPGPGGISGLTQEPLTSAPPTTAASKASVVQSALKLTVSLDSQSSLSFTITLPISETATPMTSTDGLTMYSLVSSPPAPVTILSTDSGGLLGIVSTVASTISLGTVPPSEPSGTCCIASTAGQSVCTDEIIGVLPVCAGTTTPSTAPLLSSASSFLSAPLTTSTFLSSATSLLPTIVSLPGPSSALGGLLQASGTSSTITVLSLPGVRPTSVPPGATILNPSSSSFEAVKGAPSVSGGSPLTESGSQRGSNVRTTSVVASSSTSAAIVPIAIGGFAGSSPNDVPGAVRTGVAGEANSTPASEKGGTQPTATGAQHTQPVVQSGPESPQATSLAGTAAFGSHGSGAQNPDAQDLRASPGAPNPAASNVNGASAVSQGIDSMKPTGVGLSTALTTKASTSVSSLISTPLADVKQQGSSTASNTPTSTLTSQMSDSKHPISQGIMGPNSSEATSTQTSGSDNNTTGSSRRTGDAAGTDTSAQDKTISSSAGTTTSSTSSFILESDIESMTGTSTASSTSQQSSSRLQTSKPTNTISPVWAAGNSTGWNGTSLLPPPVYVWSSNDVFVSTYLPVLLAAIYRVWWSAIQEKLSLIDPFRQMSGTHGAPAEVALFAQNSVFGLFSALRDGRWTLFIGRLPYLLAILGPAMASETVVVDTHWNCPYPPKTDLNPCPPQMSTFVPMVRLLQAFLAIDAISLIVILTALWFSQTGLPRNPGSVAGIGMLMQDPRVIADVRAMNPRDKKSAKTSFKGQKYTLGFYQEDAESKFYSGIIPLESSTEPVEPTAAAGVPENYLTDHSSEPPGVAQHRRFTWLNDGFTIGLLILAFCMILVLNVIPNSHDPYSAWFNSNTVGPRFVVVFSSSLILCQWKRTEHDTIHMAPFNRLSKQTSDYRSTIAFEPTTIPIVSTRTAVWNRYWFAALLTVTTLLGEALNVMASGVPAAAGQVPMQVQLSNYMSLTILGIMCLVYVLVLRHRKHEPRVLHRPFTLAARMSYLTESRMMRGFDEEHHKIRMERKPTSSYAFKPVTRGGCRWRWAVDEVHEMRES